MVKQGAVKITGQEACQTQRKWKLVKVARASSYVSGA